MNTNRHTSESGRSSQNPSYVRMAPLSGVIHAIFRRIKEKNERIVLVVPGRKEGEEAFQSSRIFGGKESVRFFPHYELNPYESSSPNPDIAATRVRTLFSIMSQECGLVIATAEAFSSFTAPPGELGKKVLTINEGMDLKPEDLIRWLLEAGYQRIPEVSDRGDFSLRGGIVDMYTPGMELPARAEFWGDRVESIRFFDPSSQRTIRKGKGVTIYPASEVVRLEQKGLSQSMQGSDRVERFFETGERFGGIEYYLPRIYGKGGMLLDYFEDDPHIIMYDYSEIQRRQQFLTDLAQEIYQKGRVDAPVPDELFLDREGVDMHIESRSRTIIDLYHDHRGTRELFGIDISPVGGHTMLRASPLKLEGLFSLLREGRIKDRTSIITVSTKYRLEVMKSLLEDNEFFPRGVITEGEDAATMEPGTYLMISGIEKGFFSENSSLMVVTDHEIFGKRVFTRAVDPRERVKRGISYDSLKENDYVVHDNYGIGLFRGIKAMEVDDIRADFGIIEYDSGDILYLPIYRMDLLQRYVGGEGSPPRLDRLGSNRWETTKRRVKEKVQKVAAELLLVHASREVSGGFAFEQPDAAFQEFAAGFEYEETPDQEKAIKDVIDDMTGERPMDRLICGDVGYGKTEVALRASFLAVMSGKQVAFLCPTTVLAQQHFRTYSDRFEKFPVVVAVLSRFVKGREQKKILDDLAQGKVDILIGTHRLLQRDVAFRDLGLLIVDEEQKFGVMHKEKLKKMRTAVDVLTLSATPIPRTLHITLSGIKDISIISTPPKERLSVKTFVVNFSEEIIREGIGRELRRGGQVYYIHNRIETIDKVEQFLRELVPDARIEVAHGQMEEDRLDSVMKRFYRGDLDVLLCTAIVESGLDIPRANTMVVDRSHTFGLAQLYQLRGRIGRDRKRAYAYLVVPPRKALSTEAMARLSAIEELSELGSGFQVASFDLDIRGGGDILGPSQSGHVQHVGYDMYVRFLEEAVAELKGMSTPSRPLPDVELHVKAYIPDEYIRNPQSKLDCYRKIAMIRSSEEYEEMYMELVDRYGTPAESVLNLLKIALLRSDLSHQGIRELKMSREKLYFSFEADSPLDRKHIAGLVMEGKGKYGFDKKGTFFAVTAFDGSNWNQLSSELQVVLGRTAEGT